MLIQTIEVKYHFFPTAWPDGTARQVFELLIGPDKLMPATKWGNEGRESLPDDLKEKIDWLTDRYEASHKGNRIPLFTNKRLKDGFYLELFRSEWHEDSLIGSLLHWAKDMLLDTLLERGASEEGLDVITKVAALTKAPYVSLDYRMRSVGSSISLDAAREHKRVVQGTIHANASAGPWRGLHRIPWRLIIGEHIVATIGIDKLRKLAPEMGIDHGNGLWTLQTTVDPANSILDMGRDAEREIIETLGEEFFANTDQNTLAKTPPKFPAELIPQDSRLFERYGEKLKPL